MDPCAEPADQPVAAGEPADQRAAHGELREHGSLLLDPRMQFPVARRIDYIHPAAQHRKGLSPCLQSALVGSRVDALGHSTDHAEPAHGQGSGQLARHLASV